MNDGERIRALERAVDVQQKILNEALDLLGNAYSRLLAIQQIVVAKGLLDPAEIEAVVARMQGSSDLAVELGPEYKEFRRIRQEIQGRLDEEERDEP